MPIRDNIEAKAVVHPITFIGRLLDDVEDRDLQTGIIAVLEAADQGIRAVKAIDIERFELDPRLEEGLAIWPLIDGPVMAFMKQLETVSSVTPKYFLREISTLDISDLDLDLEIEDLKSGLPSPVRDQYELKLDQIYAGVSIRNQETMRRAIAELGELLQRTAKEHCMRLQNPFLRRDSFSLLEDIHELRCRSERMLQTLVAVVIRGLVDVPVREIYPEYMTCGERSACIRAWTVDFSEELKAVKHEESLDDSFHALVSMVANAARKRELAWLRSSDRAVVQGFRRWLRVGGSPSPSELSNQMKRLTEWMDSMHMINHRAILLVHDIEIIEEMCELIGRSFRVPALYSLMEGLYGRHASFDRIVRAARDGHWPDLDFLISILDEMRSGLSSLAREITSGGTN